MTRRLPGADHDTRVLALDCDGSEGNLAWLDLRTLELPGDVVRSLRNNLGAKLVAYLSEVPDTAALNRWVTGAATPSARILARLQAASHAAGTLLRRDDQRTVQAWFQGTNPQLGDVSPRSATARRRGGCSGVGHRSCAERSLRLGPRGPAASAFLPTKLPRQCKRCVPLPCRRSPQSARAEDSALGPLHMIPVERHLVCGVVQRTEGSGEPGSGASSRARAHLCDAPWLRPRLVVPGWPRREPRPGTSSGAFHRAGSPRTRSRRGRARGSGGDAGVGDSARGEPDLPGHVHVAVEGLHDNGESRGLRVGSQVRARVRYTRQPPSRERLPNSEQSRSAAPRLSPDSRRPFHAHQRRRRGETSPSSAAAAMEVVESRASSSRGLAHQVPSGRGPGPRRWRKPAELEASALGQREWSSRAHPRPPSRSIIRQWGGTGTCLRGPTELRANPGSCASVSNRPHSSLSVRNGGSPSPTLFLPQIGGALYLDAALSRPLLAQSSDVSR